MLELSLSLIGWRVPATGAILKVLMISLGLELPKGRPGRHYFTQLFVRTPSYRPGTYGIRYAVYSVPTSRDRKSESRVVETRQPSDYKRPLRKPRREKDPRKRPGRKRTGNGWVQTLD